MIADFHIHSDFSDGDSRPEDIVRMAISLGMSAVAVVDHVNAGSDWVDIFSEEMDRLRNSYDGRILVLSGLEAKCKNLGGDLDIAPEAAESVDFVIGAIHRIPDEDGFIKSEELALHADTALENWRRSVSSMLANPMVDVWAHPGRLLLLHGVEIPPALWDELSSTAAANSVFAELTVSAPENLRIPSDIFERNRVRVIPASDCHRMHEMPSFASRCTCDDASVKEFLSRVGRRMA